MKVHYQRYNKGVKYCCPSKLVKELFRNTDITLNFGGYVRKYDPFPNELGYSYFSKKIKGVIISKLTTMYSGSIPTLCFYLIKETEWTSELQYKFENEVLQQLFDFYNDMILSDRKYECVLVELLNEQLIIHKYAID